MAKTAYQVDTRSWLLRRQQDARHMVRYRYRCLYYRKGKTNILISQIVFANVSEANAIVNTAIEESNINSLGVVVLDELHMINDDHRGYLIELMASKLLVLDQNIQIVGMSATLTVGDA